MIYILFELNIIKVELGNAILYHYFLQEIKAIITSIKIKLVI